MLVENKLFGINSQNVLCNCDAMTNDAPDNYSLKNKTHDDPHSQALANAFKNQTGKNLHYLRAALSH